MKHLTIKINSLEFSWNMILKNINFILNEKNKIALVWGNWVWKTTVMKILTGEIKDFDWNIENIWNMKIWYLSQIYSDNEEKLVREELKEGFKEIIKVEKELKILEEKMSLEPENMDLIEKYSNSLEQFNNIWAYDYENKIHGVANWMGLLNLLDKKLIETSGWQRTKIALAKVLLEAPDILLLDEPTNFIDLAWVEWLESYLQNKWTWWYFIISHDREFLDKTCEKTFELQPKRQINFYHWNYTFYVEERERIEKKKIQEYSRQQEFIKKEENLINRFRAWSRASFAKSREKWLDRLEKLDKPYIPKKPKFFFEYLEQTNRKILYFKECFIWRKEPLFFISELDLYVGQRVGVLWENGVWKSTFIKTIIWQLDILEWTYTKWKWVKFVYYSQLHEELDKEKTVMQNFEKHWLYYPEQHLIGLLTHYLFKIEDINKKVKDLSWGQISKVLFAILGQNPSNLLILDEPTNHLDYDTREAMEQALNKYPWTVLFISHDRYFVNKLATHLWIIENEELFVSYWTYEDYQYKKNFNLDFDMALFNEDAQLNLVLEEKLWEKEARRLKEKFKKRRKK